MAGNGGRGSRPGFAGADGAAAAAGDVGTNSPQATVVFVYRGGQLWSEAAKNSLQAAAMSLISRVRVSASTTLTYTATAFSDQADQTLGSAGSGLVGSDPGFYDTVVAQKINTGTDANGATPDGEITWNFGQPWGYGATVGDAQFAFSETARHELIHSFGFASFVGEDGLSDPGPRPLFDRFVVAADGTPVIDDYYRFNPAYESAVTGGGGGLFFAGPNAIRTYGGPVPLYTPAPYRPGSSVSHLNDAVFSGTRYALMAPMARYGGPTAEVNAVELAILADLGFQLA